MAPPMKDMEYRDLAVIFDNAATYDKKNRKTYAREDNERYKLIVSPV
jgi:hypothetical protein